MTTWKVPPDTSQKEKIVGGVLTAAQLIWMILGLGIAAVVALTLGTAIGIVGIVIGLVLGIGFGLFFSFFKKNDIPIFTYLLLTRKHNKKVHKLPHRQMKGDRNIGGAL